MTATERKRAWRARNPERSREAERLRAAARRAGHWGEWTLGSTPKPCASAESYERYERTTQRFLQRTFWPRYGAGTTKMTDEEFRATGDAFMTELARQVRRIDTLTPEEIRVESAALLAAMTDPTEVFRLVTGQHSALGNAS